MKYVLTENIIFPAGTELLAEDDGSLFAQSDRGLVMLKMGRAAALEERMVVARPSIALIHSPTFSGENQ